MGVRFRLSNRMLSRLITRAPRRQFSKYIEDNYGKELHRLANRPGIEVKPTEVFVYACGAFLLAADIVRDNEVHRREYVANGSPDAVWNQRIWIKPDAYSMRGMAQNLF